jgi:MFS family permease
MKSNITFNPAKWLPYLAAFAQVVQFTNAGYTLFSWRGVVGGLFLGALVSVAVAYAASQYSPSWPKERRLMSIVSLVLLMTFSPVVVGTAAFLELSEIALTKLTGWAIVLSAAWGILPDYAVALCGFTAGRSWSKAETTTATTTTETAQVAATGEKKKGKPGKVAKRDFTDDEMIAQYTIDPCATDAQLAQVFGKSHTAIGNRRKSMIDKGLIEKVGKEIKVKPVYVVKEQVTK